MPIELPKKLENKSCAPDKLVLLLAALEKKYGATSANYKLMSEMSDGEYTVSSLEHFFRDFRNAAKALLQKYPEATGDQPVAATPKKRKYISQLWYFSLSLCNLPLTNNGKVRLEGMMMTMRRMGIHQNLRKPPSLRGRRGLLKVKKLLVKVRIAKARLNYWRRRSRPRIESLCSKGRRINRMLLLGVGNERGARNSQVSISLDKQKKVASQAHRFISYLR